MRILKKVDTSEKIKEFENLVEIAKRLKRKGKKIILSHGVFDLLHPGHIRHFETAKTQGDILIATVTKDEYVNKGPGRPVFNHRLRAESVAALECVDYVAVNEWPTAIETILRLKPDFYAKGSDYKKKEDDLTGKIFDEEKAVKSVGGSILFTEEITFSSSQILNLYFSVYPKETDVFLKKFKKKSSSDLIVNVLKDVSDLKVLVLGDTIIDEYHYCIGIGKPQKADVLATKYLSEERFTGGVLAVAKHVANFCKEVHLISAIGTQNNFVDFISNNLMSNIKTKFFYRDDVPTVVKRRYLDPSFLNKNFEINFVDDAEIPKPLAKDVCKYVSTIIRDFDLVIVADFGHGFINGDIVKMVSEKSKFLCANTQTNSANMGFNLITKYPRADYICIDEPEIRLAMQDRFAGLEDLIHGLRRKLKCDKIIVTRGHMGSIAYEKGKGFTCTPAFSKEIVDRVGAGDAFLSITAPIASKNYPLDLVGFIGNAVGALAVLIVGNRAPIERVPLYKFITTLLK